MRSPWPIWPTSPTPRCYFNFPPFPVLCFICARHKAALILKLLKISMPDQQSSFRELTLSPPFKHQSLYLEGKMLHETDFLTAHLPHLSSSLSMSVNRPLHTVMGLFHLPESSQSPSLLLDTSSLPQLKSVIMDMVLIFATLGCAR